MQQDKDFIIQEGFIPVSDIHTIYFATYGNPKGIPLLGFHGGPGGGFSTRYLNMIDLTKFYVVFFDQRGCGKSTPEGEIKNNTCQNAIDDAKLVLNRLNIKKCVVSGYSYGGVLALAFAMKFKPMVISIYVSSVCIPANLNKVFFEQDNSLYQEYKDFLNVIKTTDSNLLFYEYENCSLARKKEIVVAIVNWELALFQLDNKQEITIEQVDNRLIYAKRLFLSYVAQNYFNLGKWMLQKINNLSDIPINIVQGARDKLTPVSSAYEIQKILPHSNIVITPNAGHVGRVITRRFYDEVNTFTR